jgi:hypothetical protein
MGADKQFDIKTNFQKSDVRAIAPCGAELSEHTILFSVSITVGEYRKQLRDYLLRNTIMVHEEFYFK